MRSLQSLFGRSPFEPLLDHSRKVNECVQMARKVAEAFVAGDFDTIQNLQHEISRTEYEADQLKNLTRENLPTRYFLPVNREDVSRFLSQMDKVADSVEDFAVIASLRKSRLPEELHEGFLELVDKVLQASSTLLGLTEELAELQKESFAGPDVKNALLKIEQVCHMEWETDKLSRKLARQYYAIQDIDPVMLIILDKLCHALGQIADHAEGVCKNLRLMIARK